MTKVFVVFGQCGEYSSRKEWPVCAFVEEQAARDLVERLTVAAHTVHNLGDRYEIDAWDQRASFMKEAGDPSYDDYSTDVTTYSYAEIEVRD